MPDERPVEGSRTQNGTCRGVPYPYNCQPGPDRLPELKYAVNANNQNQRNWDWCDPKK